MRRTLFSFDARLDDVSLGDAPEIQLAVPPLRIVVGGHAGVELIRIPFSL
jgi:hypothetical protein